MRSVTLFRAPKKKPEPPLKWKDKKRGVVHALIRRDGWTLRGYWHRSGLWISCRSSGRLVHRVHWIDEPVDCLQCMGAST